MNNLKPFNLEAALAGKKVVTRDGIHVSGLLFGHNITTGYPITAYVAGDDQFKTYMIDGGWASGKTSQSDLFMAPEEVTGFVNIYSTEQGYMVGGNIHAVKSIAIEASGLPNATYITTVPITFTI